MNTFIEKSITYNPIAGQQLGGPSHEQQYVRMSQSLNFSNNQKTSFLKQNSNSMNREELEKRANQFITSKYDNKKVTYNDNHDEFCVCADCTYKRRLSKPSQTLFNLTLSSIYRQSYPKNDHTGGKTTFSYKYLNKSIDDFSGKDVNERQFSLHSKNKVTLQTIYKQQMRGVTEQRTKLIRNVDNLRFDGPLHKISVYRQKFPGVSGQNPYVKPINDAFRQDFKLDAKTTNSTFYKGEFIQRSALAKSPDNIRTGLPMLFKQSTSQKFYSPPINSKQLNFKAVKTTQKRVKSPEDKQQFESIYRSSFNSQDAEKSAINKRRLM